jgi:hypothetical protein
VSDRKGEKLREKETQNRGRTEGLKAEKKSRRQRGGEDKRNHRTGEERNQGKTREQKLKPRRKKTKGERRK